MKATDISKLTGINYWTWKAEAQALLLAEGCWTAIDPAIPVPNGVVQQRTWNDHNMKAYGLLYLTLGPSVQKRVNNASIGVNGRFLWQQLESFYVVSDSATRSMLMNELNALSHDLTKPADDFLQAVVNVEQRLTAIAVSLPPFMIQDKILSGLSSVYSPITTVLQNESTPRSIPAMITAINAWEQADLQRGDSIIRAARSALSNHGGVGIDPDFLPARGPEALVARDRTRNHHSSSIPSRSSRSSANKEFDWTNTKNRTDVCYRCGLPGHFAQFCVSKMPDNVRRRIIRDREKDHANAAYDSAEDNDQSTEPQHFAAAAFAFDPTTHWSLAAQDLPLQFDLLCADPSIKESYIAAYTNPPDSDRDSPAPASPTLTASTSSVSASPLSKKQLKKKRQKEKKKQRSSTHSAEIAMENLSLREEEEDGNETEYSM